MQRFKTLIKNTKGKDYVVGDIHGSYSLLIEHLKKVSFDTQVDRLIFLGDLINKGKENEQCLTLLDEPWFHPVIGNHEIMFIEAFLYNDFAMIYEKGSDWFDHTHLSIGELVNWATRISNEIPFGMELISENKRFGFVHAEPLEDWDDVRAILDNPWSFDEYFTNKSEKMRDLKRMIWSRNKFNSQNHSQIKNVHQVYVGHTPNEKVYEFGNVKYIDLGSYKSGNLHIEEIK